VSAARLAAVAYTGLSLLVGLAFFAVTLLTGDYTWVARTGGAIWVFGLCMIILMPTVTPWVRERRRRS
jgi:type IV secretory pathway TrbD component